MGRPKGFVRNQVLAKTAELFWKQGFAETSLQDLERATSLNKSSLYAEFKDKEELFTESLRYYAATSGVIELLSREPLGWKNIEDLLKMGLACKGGRGCFIVNTVREANLLPKSARAVVDAHLEKVREMLMKNLCAVVSKSEAQMMAPLILNFNSGLCLEQNLGPSEAPEARIKYLMKILKQN